MNSVLFMKVFTEEVSQNYADCYERDSVGFLPLALSHTYLRQEGTHYQICKLTNDARSQTKAKLQSQGGKDSSPPGLILFLTQESMPTALRPIASPSSPPLPRSHSSPLLSPTARWVNAVSGVFAQGRSL